MIYSMTAYARLQNKDEFGTITWELRSVNQRYLETYLRLPEQLRGLEPLLRERLGRRLQRGKLECNLRFDATSSSSMQLKINKPLVSQLIEAAHWVRKEAQEGQLDLLDVLRWPGAIETQEQDMDALSTALMGYFDATLEQFIEARSSEGAKLSALIEQRLEQIKVEVGKVRELMPTILEWQRQRLSDRLAEAKAELDPARLEQEMIILAQKMDVAEELDRLDTHISETRKILKKGGACGRRLDFMMQEFNREANTLASKSISTDITASAVELKVLIEQMREQIQNIE